MAPQNPPAFPSKQPERVRMVADGVFDPVDPRNYAMVEANYPGMSLRDYFAAQYLAGAATWQISNDAGWKRVVRWLVGGQIKTITSGFGGDSLAPTAYTIADAMLAEREKGGQ